MRLVVFSGLLLSGCAAEPPRLLPPDPASKGGTLYVFDVFQDFLDDGGYRLVHPPTRDGGCAWLGEQGLRLLFRWSEAARGTTLLRADRFDVDPDGRARVPTDEPVVLRDRTRDGKPALRAAGWRNGYRLSLRVRPRPEALYLDVEFALFQVRTDSVEAVSTGRQTIARGGALLWMLPRGGDRAHLVLAQVASSE